MNESFAFVLLGIVTGVLSGLFGVGGGIIMVPALVWIFHFSQHQAQGISLATILIPVGIFAVMAYYKTNPFPVKVPFLIALGILIGSLTSSHFAQQISEKSLKNGFAILMILAALKMLIGK
ncbi:MAG: sulfite exporter TauE/SafE family protein [Proteobacteria bacterium]|jgi:uncharacterized membrane protein YfcA|nr:sulfite exporter TauE/SafE family protein [Pseudomonadota bacterium]